GTKALVERQLGHLETHDGLEPLAIVLHHRDRGDRHLERLACEACDALEALLERGIERIDGVQAGQLQRGRARDRAGKRGVLVVRPGHAGAPWSRAGNRRPALERVGTVWRYRRGCSGVTGHGMVIAVPDAVKRERAATGTIGPARFRAAMC